MKTTTATTVITGMVASRRRNTYTILAAQAVVWAAGGGRFGRAHWSSIQTVSSPRPIMSMFFNSLRAAKAAEYWPTLM